MPPPSPEPLAPGSTGDRVAALQRRLAALRYWIGPIDGVYGELTSQAVMAFEKANDVPPDGIADPDVLRRLAAAPPPRPASTAGDLVEIDKTRQLVIVVRSGTTAWVFNTSTGTELAYNHPSGALLMADTPPGWHTFFSRYDGTQPGELGPLYRPIYFHHDGIAIHGYGSVPARPASHGCVRVSFAAMDFIWSQHLAPLGGAVWVYGTSPSPAASG